MKKDMILHKIGQLIVPLKRTMSPLVADSHSACARHFFNRSLLLLLLMILGVGNVWGEGSPVGTDRSGYYYIINLTLQGNDTRYNPDEPQNGYYLCPAAPPANPADGYNYDAVYYDGDSKQKPYLTTYKKGRVNDAVWKIEYAETDNTDNDNPIDYYYIRYCADNNKYLTHNTSRTTTSNRLTVHLQTEKDGNNSMFCFETGRDDASSFFIRPRQVSSGDRHLNPPQQNYNEYYGTGGKKTAKINNVTIDVGGMIGYYTSTKSTPDDQASQWYLEKAAPVVTYNSSNLIEISYIFDESATIYYSYGEESTPSPSSEGTYSYSETGPFDPPSGTTTIKAIAVNGNEVSGTAIYTIPFLLGSTHTYIIQSKQCQFYNLIPNVTVDENTKYVSTLNVPCTTMAWHFEYAEEGYYYIVDANGWYMYYTTTDNSSKYIYLKSTLDNNNLDNFKFKITAHASGGFNIIPKGQTLSVNKAYNGLTPAKLGGSIGDNTSRWDIIQYNSANLPMWAVAPFTNMSDTNHTYYHKIISVSTEKPIILNDDGDIKSQDTDGIDERKTLWVIKKVGATDDNNDLLDFYTFQNVFNGELLYYNGKGRNCTTSVLQLGMPEGAIEAWSHFVIVQTETGYNIIPRSIIDNTKAINTSSANEGFNCLNRRGGNDVLGTYYDDGGGSRWTFSKVDFCLPPFFEETNGSITISCDTKGAEIHFLTDGNDPTGASTLYNNDNWSSSDQVRIKAIAVVKDGETVKASSAIANLLNKPDITLEAGPYEYKGAAWEPSLTVSIGESGSETTAPTSPASYTTTYANNINAGTATVTLTDVEGDSWYILNGSTTFTITQKAITITAASDTKGYDGTPLTNDGYTYSPALATGDSFESVTLTGSQTDVGSSSNVPSAAVIKNENDEDVTANYAITYTNGTLTVTLRSIGDGSLASGFTLEFGEGGTIILKDGEITLIKDTDYSIGSETTSESGKYSQRTVSGIRNYEGSFSIRNANVNFQNDGNGGTEYSATFVAENAAGPASNDPANGHALPEGITAYIITSISGNNANAETLGYIPEGIPVLLLSNAASAGFLVQDASGHTAITSAQISNNMLEEVTSSTPGFISNEEDDNYQKVHFDVATIYLLYKNEFVLNKEGYLAKGKIYLNPNHGTGGGGGGSGARLRISKGDNTGIENIEYTTDSQSGVWHTLDGRRLSSKPTKKGLYLQGGKKVVVK